MRIALLAFLIWPAFALALECTARSGERTAALVELYTSEGCSSCPPADRWLSSLSKTYATDRVVPLALHVDDWDYIGWKDPYARREFSQRQRRLSQMQRLALVYTPQVVLQGSDFRRWGTSDFDLEVARINARPAGARLELEIVSRSAESLAVRVRGASARGDAALFVAAYENGLQSAVHAGENRGRLLRHDYVALEWRGPYGLGEHEIRLPLLPKARPADSGVVAFVQDRRTAEVLQALLLGVCSA